MGRPGEQSNVSLKRFESMLKTNDVYFFDSEEFEEIIHHYLEIGKIALAKKATKLGLEQHPSASSLRLFQVEMFIFEDKLEEAETLLEELQLLEQSNEEIYIQKANISSRKDNHKEAIAYLEQALALTNDQADVLSLIGMEYLFLDDYKNAKQQFIKCLEFDDQDYSALYNVIYCFDYLQENEAAIEYLNDFLDKNPYSEVAWHQIGKQYYYLKDYKKALAAFDFAIISDDGFIGAYLEKGKTQQKLKNYAGAIESYTVTLGLDDPTSFALLRIGKCYEKLGEMELSLQFYLKCVEEDGLLDKAWIAITDYYFRKKDFQKCFYYIEKALNVDSENVLYWKRYAAICKKLNLLEEAEHAYRRSLELGDTDIDTWIGRTDLLIHIGEFKAAVENLTQATEYYASHPEIEYRLAGLYFHLNEQSKGRFYLNNALRTDPEYKIILEELFPIVYQNQLVKQLISKHQNPSL
ncbi:TPR repeat containing protein [unidentified eubacterium SCB49]|nr:TPR repeat containing protein [unidentified eubacterium SCB49]